MTAKLDAGQKHMLRLISKHTDADGWGHVSPTFFPLLEDGMPKELIELDRVGSDGRGRVRLTSQGLEVINAMAWGLT